MYVSILFYSYFELIYYNILCLRCVRRCDVRKILILLQIYLLNKETIYIYLDIFYLNHTLLVSTTCLFSSFRVVHYLILHQIEITVELFVHKPFLILNVKARL